MTAIMLLVYELRLYEGTSENTQDLHGRKKGSVRLLDDAFQVPIEVTSEEPFSADEAYGTIYLDAVYDGWGG